MLVTLRDVEVYVEPEEIIFQSLSDGDIPVRDIVAMCQEEAGTEEVLKSIEDRDIQVYCDTKGIELKCDLNMIIKNIRILSREERASLLWELMGVDDEEIKKSVTVEIVIPKLNDLIRVTRGDKNV